MSRLRTALVAAPLVLLGLAARAPAMQTAPDLEPHGFVEPCTLANVQETDIECELCAQGQRQECGQRLASHGYLRKCRTRGASSGGWDEIWCTAPANAAPKMQPENGQTSSTRSVLIVSVTIALIAGFWLYRRRSSSEESR